MGLFYASSITFVYFVLVFVFIIFYKYKAHAWKLCDGRIKSFYQNYSGEYDSLFDKFEVPEYLKMTKAEYEYSYTVEGKIFKSNIVFLGDFFMFSGRTFFQPYSKLRFSKGDNISVHYNERNPSESVIYKEIPARFKVLLFFGLLVSSFLSYYSFDFTSSWLSGVVVKVIVSVVFGAGMFIGDFLRSNYSQNRIKVK
ncbi:DUF3592 domain-containing protein [Endozoicomonas arenosclerae]|uniref:DUF3592 domain-containing protein n=1 Tax=Endozoicomonas arenosclerae TaxID=1633495 RepID=UPI0007838345|nr:DUF3592 domain-containing protein [Endozoicomonas arenosclerae]